MVDGIVCYYFAFLLYGLYANWKARTPTSIIMTTMVLELPVMGRLLELW
jgi:hypothetical protein